MPRWLLPVLSVLFFLSGLCALIYQVMWLRLLSFVFGVTVYAASTVLASFMSGLAIGSFAASRGAGRLRSPLMVFGLLEIGIGTSAFATPFLLDAVKGLWIAIEPTLPSSIAFLTAARFVAALAILIVPTTLMGATLPVVMRSALGRTDTVGSRIGLLYAINTGGAILGALIAGFYLLAEIGMARSFQIAAVINVLIGSLALLASRAVPNESGPQPEPGSSHGPHVAEAKGAAEQAGLKPRPPDLAQVSASGDATRLSVSQRRAVLWTFFLSGLMSLALEIVWFRMLVTMLRPTAYAFTIMLAAVLVGITAGSALAAPMLRQRREWLPALTVIQVLIGVTAVLSLNALRHVENVEAWLRPLFDRLGIDPYLGPLVGASVLAMLPTTALLGFAFPVGLALYSRDTTDSSRRIGAFYSLNVCGAIIGSILGGFVLLPLAGSRGSLIATAAVATASSVMLALAQWRTRPNFAGFVALVSPVAFAMAAINAIDPYSLTADPAERVMWRQEGVQTTVSVHETGAGARPNRVMYLDGMHQASDHPNMAFVHHRIGALPMMLHPNPRQALVVGLGGGATAGAVAQFPGVEVDVVELSSAVVGGATFFSHINFGLLDRPSVTLRVADGRNHLLTTRKKYDVITADIILPRHAGAGALYSRQYFELVHGALADDGLALQWNGGEGAVYNLILRSFLSVFPHTTLWADGTLMLGSKKPFTFSRAAYEQRRSDPQFRRLFDWSYEQLAGTYLAGPDQVRPWVGEGRILTDDRPVIEYFLSLPTDEPRLDTRALHRRPADIERP